MKPGWVEKKLGKISAISYGFTERASFEAIGPRFLRITDIQNDNVEWESVPFCKIDDKDSLRYRLETGDIVFARTGATTGKSYLVIDPPDAVFASYLIRLRLQVDELLPEFVYLFFQTSTYWKVIREGVAGSAQGGFNATKLAEISIPIPSLAEQQRIVAILDETFAGIDAAKANAEQNLNNARELFDGYLAQVFVKQGPNWEMKTLQQIALDFGRGKSRHRPRNDPKLYGGVYPFVQTGDIRNADHVVATYTQTYNEVGLSQSKLWPKGTLCITIAANIAETGILDFEACFPDSVIGVVVNDKISSNGFVEYLLQSYKAQLQAKGKGSAQDNINMGTFENQLFPFPSLPDQQAIVAKLDALSAKTQLLEVIYRQKIAALDELKQSLLHQAFTGEL